MSEQQTKRDDGGPAFPTIHANGTTKEGMSRRDWLAGLAMQGFVANPNLDSADYQKAAKWCYKFADAMIAEGKK